MRPTLYLLMGYPGSGKTTASKIIAQLTGATHLWADQIRRDQIKQPTYSEAENDLLYRDLNEKTDILLSKGTSVVFDTSFNLYRDREHLRAIADSNDADCRLIWIQVPKPIAKTRAVDEAHLHKTRALGAMPEQKFSHLINKLEPPKPNEHALTLDGTKLTPTYIDQKLSLNAFV